MSGFGTTRLSSKGQVVIPEEIRDDLHLKSGDRFVVIGKGDTVILKTITGPSIDSFDALVLSAATMAKMAGLKKSSVKEAIRKARRSTK